MACMYYALLCSTSAISLTSLLGNPAPLYYDLLALDQSAAAHQIKKAYRKMALLHHPDKGGDEYKFKLIAEAYEILSDSSTRAFYDKNFEVVWAPNKLTTEYCN